MCIFTKGNGFSKKKSLLLLLCLSMGASLPSAYAKEGKKTNISFQKQDQNILIKGTVLEPDGTPVIGAYILVSGEENGTITDTDGQFSIKVANSNAVLEIQSMGFVSQKLQVGNRSELNITLLTDNKQLNEVVVTALGVKRETKALGYSVQEVKGNELVKAKEANVVNSLAGRVAGVQVTGGNSGVGSTSLISIRGESSLIPGNNSPLFVVDGVPISNRTTSNRNEGNLEVDYGNGASDINSDDIESISVLKGANATALYGSRGANGVILITTKSGEGQKGLGVSFSTGMTFEEPLRLPKYQNTYGQGSNFAFEYENGAGKGIADGVDESWGPKLDQIDPATGEVIRIKQHDSPTTGGFGGGDTHPSLDRGDIIATPWKSNPSSIEDFFKTGVTWNYNVAVASGNENGSFRLSNSNLKSEGILPNTDYRRNNFSLNATHKLNDWIKASASVNYVNSGSSNRPSNSYGTENIMYLWAWFGRQIDMNSLKDYWQPGLEGVQQYNYNSNWHDNPYFTMHENTNAFNKNRLFGNVKLDFQFTKELSLMLRAGSDFFYDKRIAKRAFSTQRFGRGQYREDDIFFQENNYDFLLNYNKDINSDWNVGLSFGGNQREEKNEYKRISANELNVPNVYNFENSRIPLAKSQFNSKKSVNSLYGFANVAYKNLLFLDVTGRNDWSSTLPTAHNSYFYPSVSLSGVISDMVKLPDFVSFLKLRAGWAKVGNDTDAYALNNVLNLVASPVYLDYQNLQLWLTRT